VPERGAAAVETIAQLVRAGVRPDARLLQLPVPPTAAVVVAVALHTGRLPAGAVGALARAVAERCCTYTMVDSVASFTTPAPSVFQHAWSLVPGSRFFASSRPPAVHRVWGTLPPPLDEAFLTISTSADDPSSQRWREDLEALFPAAEPGQVALAAPGPPGVRRWAELTAVPLPLSDFVARLHAQLTVLTCPWCSAEIAGDVCPYCGVAVAAPGPVGLHGSAPPIPSPSSSLFPRADREAPTAQSRRAS
jgi:hypothetical protein